MRNGYLSLFCLSVRGRDAAGSAPPRRPDVNGRVL
jgi:hypothetical protein